MFDIDWDNFSNLSRVQNVLHQLLCHRRGFRILIHGIKDRDSTHIPGWNNGSGVRTSVDIIFVLLQDNIAIQKEKQQEK